MNINFEQVNAAALSMLPQLLSDWFPNGRKVGNEYVVGDLSGAPGESLSINLRTSAWADFASDKRGGDVTSLFAARNSLTQLDAARRLSVILGVDTAAPSPAAKPAPVEWAAVMPVPSDAPQPPDRHFKHGAPSGTWAYRNRDGALLGYILRCDPDGGRKQILPLTFCENAEGRRMWRWLSFPKPRPLYGLELLNAGGRILIVEGEKACDAARRLLGDAITVVTWPGGGQAVAYADWSVLAGRDVVVWPDADKPGRDAAAQIVIQLRHHRATVRVVDLPAGLSDGWDAADAEAEGFDALGLIDPAPVMEYEPVPEYDYPDHDGGGFDEPVAFDFKPLGHDRGRFYFFTSGGGQVRDFSARDLQSVGSLCELAPLRYWEMNYAGKGESGFNVRGAGDAMVRACYQARIYDAERLRGRGAWLDEGRTVLHIGDRLVVDGIETDICSMKSKFIYEQGRRLSFSVGDNQLTSERASKLMDLCMAAPWEDPGSMGRMLAGWLVIAPVCGAMPWRPHIYITGEAGSGKSWVIENLLRPVIGEIGLPVASKTTEAGIRGDLGLDARPVIFDEFETQNEADRSRVQLVLDLARQASSEDGAAIVKGTQTGGSRRYRIRSCFAFSSINLGLQQAADESRTVVLNTVLASDPAVRRDRFNALLKLHAEVMTPDFRPALLARTLALLPTIRTNAEVFASAIARAGVSRRTGDTIGVLLAGAWSLRSRKVATADEADQFLAGSVWVRSAVMRSEADPEWRRALDFMIQVPLRTAISNRSVHQDIPVGELIGIISGHTQDPVTSRSDAEATLARAGIKVELDAYGNATHILTANSSEVLRRAFSTTSWSSSWAATIARAPGAEKLQKPVKFASLTSRGLRINIKIALGHIAGL